MDTQQQHSQKLTDKAFSRLLLTSVLWILLCLFGLGSATWALFGVTVSGDHNRLEAGSFDLAVTVVSQASGEALPVETAPSGVRSCTLGGAGTYTVTLTVTDDTTVSKGYCAIRAGGTAFKTAAVNAEGQNSITFSLETQKAEITVYFTPTWGFPARFDVANGEALPLPGPKTEN